MKFTDQIETHGKGEGGVGIGMARQTGEEEFDVGASVGGER